MHRFIIARPGSFLFAVIGGIVAFTGLGALSMGFGVPVVPLLYLQFAAYSLFALYIPIAVSDKVAGVVALALAAAVPLLLPFARLEYAMRETPLAALALVVAGAGASTAIYMRAMRPESNERSGAQRTPAQELLA